MGHFSALFLTIKNDPGFRDETSPPPSHWNHEDIPDLTGKVFIVTGANTGIGYETVKSLLKKNARVYAAARSPTKGRDAIQRLKEETGNEAIFLHLDLGDLNSVKRAAEEFKQKESQLHVLINNAGVMTPPKDQFTTQGWDLQFGTNVIGHFLLIKFLLPTLLATAQSSPSGTVRIVNTSSSAQYWYHDIPFDVLKDGKARNKLCPEQLYGVSKRGNIVVSSELARRYGGDRGGIISTSLNPGAIATDLQRHMSSPFVQRMSKYIAHPPSLGAITQLWAATSEEGKALNGKFLKPWARIGKAAPGCEDPEMGTRLWDFLEEAVKDYL
ncbi:NAD(P)-binding protein [Flagelloscypha sp. PMI_526]|nr:NAD(P)-binding protein [Flagelloscypha sp. PMI_526]